MNQQQAPGANLANRLVWFFLTTAIVVVFSLVSAFALNQSERIVKVEERMGQLERSLVRFETKLDLLLDRLQEERGRR